jgi:UDP-2,3-diacylglucosamine hydrolase
MDVTPAEVDVLLREFGVTTMIHGHTHRPAVHEFMLDGTDCKRVVLGDWGDQGWFVTLGDSPQLQRFPIQH